MNIKITTYKQIWLFLRHSLLKRLSTDLAKEENKLTVQGTKTIRINSVQSSLKSHSMWVTLYQPSFAKINDLKILNFALSFMFLCFITLQPLQLYKV